MIKFINGNLIYALYGERSYNKYNALLVVDLKAKYGQGVFDQEPQTRDILKFCYDWAAEVFLNLMHGETDVRFLYYLFKIHEDSIKLYYESLTDAKSVVKKGVNINTLSLNRRVLKLALEQCCDINYTGKPVHDPAVMAAFLTLLEDLLFIGERLFAFAEHMAEQRMMENPIQFIIEENEYSIKRNYHYDTIYGIMYEFQDGFADALVDVDSVNELRIELQQCMGINYDFAGGQILEIKKHFSPNAPNLQTVQYEVLAINLQRNGVSVEDSENFYAGLTISHANKLSIKESVYLPSSFQRYFFRPILMVKINGKERALVGTEKWQESILVMATNGFQWQQAPEEWKRNVAFRNYLNRKANEHDKLLEDRVKAILNHRKIPYIHHVLQLSPLRGEATRIEREPGEIDFIIIDSNALKILVVDCKYHRARYEMVGFSSDYRNFRDNYEPKINKKVAFIQHHLTLLEEHFRREGLINYDISKFEVSPLFIVNTPTFYILNGRVTTVSVVHLEGLIENCYAIPKIIAGMQDGDKEIQHPYFSIQ